MNVTDCLVEFDTTIRSRYLHDTDSIGHPHTMIIAHIAASKSEDAYNTFMAKGGMSVSKYPFDTLFGAAQARLAAMANPQAVYICCDGACSGNGVSASARGGWGFVLARHNVQGASGLDGVMILGYGGEKPTTNNRMEMSAVISALAQLPEGDAPILVESDSKYVIQGCTEWRANWERRGMRTAAGKPVENQDLWVSLWKLIDARKVSFQWVKGHSGYVPNEVADMLAVQGANEMRSAAEAA